MGDHVNMRSSIYNFVCSSTTVSQSISLPFFSLLTHSWWVTVKRTLWL